MYGNVQFSVLMLVSFSVYLGIIRLVLRGRTVKPDWVSIVGVGIVAVGGGMAWGKFGANQGWPWQIYYTVPMLLTVFLPPLAFKMRLRETLAYLILSFLSAPVIHIFFSFFFGWKDFMPFIKIPSVWQLLGGT